jgi:hypothetical protein
VLLAADPGVAELAREVGVVSWLTKPVSADRLLAAVGSWSAREA